MENRNGKFDKKIERIRVLKEKIRKQILKKYERTRDKECLEFLKHI